MTDPQAKEEKSKEKVEGIPILAMQDVQFSDPLPDVHTAALPIAGCAWIDTDDGVVLIDTLLNEKAAAKALEKVNGTIKYIIYTHGHGDHVGGTRAFMEHNPEVIASKYLPDRFEKYKMLAPHIARCAAQQFNIPEDPAGRAKTMADRVYPTKTFLGEMTISLGGKTFELHTARAETDDAVWVWVPEIKCAFIGDLIIGVFPNIGNPWKPTRFALDWAKTLESVRAKGPEYVFCNGAGVIYKGQDALDALDANIEVIRNLHDQVVDYINQGMHISEMIHAVKVPHHLKDNPYLAMLYSLPEFFVYNVYRWYHGYFDGNPANLLPRPEKEVNQAILDLIGEPEKVLSKAEDLFRQGQAQLGLQVLDVLLQSDPESIAARKLRIEILEEIGSQDTCLMSRNSWVYFIDKDKAFLRGKGAL